MRREGQARHRRQRTATLLLVVGAHIVLVALLRGVLDGNGRRGVAEPPRVSIRWIPLPSMPPIMPSAPPEISRAPARSADGPRARAAAIDRTAEAAPAATAAAPVASTEPAASAPEAVPSLIDSEATRRAIRAIARAPSLSEQLARSRDEPYRPNVQERLGHAVKTAGKGDCLKGEYAGAGMGLLSLPFLAVAEARGDCAQ